MGYIFLSDDYIFPFEEAQSNGMLCCQNESRDPPYNITKIVKNREIPVKIFCLVRESVSGITYQWYYCVSTESSVAFVSYANGQPVAPAINVAGFIGPNTATRLYYGFVGATFDNWRGYVNYLPEEALNPEDISWQSMVDDGIWDDTIEIPITYVPVNSILNGPAQANIGDAVEVDVSFPDGYKLKDATQGSGISVYNENGYIDFTYDEGTRKLRFTMPE